MNEAKNKFDHIFEGYSVWLEPCPTDAREIIAQMEILASQCGGVEQGAHPFPPHCTLLYNFDSSTFKESMTHDEEKNTTKDESALQRDHGQIGLMMLESCIQKYQQQEHDDLENHDDTIDNTKISPKPILRNLQCKRSNDLTIYLNPTDFYFFPYPKHADNGRGFGCVISMLLLEKNQNLQRLQFIVSQMFPPDERHGLKKDNVKEEINNSTAISPISRTTSKKHKSGGKFTPHMTLVYAPEIYHDLVHTLTEEMKDTKRHFLSSNEPSPPLLKAKYLSLWNTKGRVKDWKMICRVELF